MLEEEKKKKREDQQDHEHVCTPPGTAPAIARIELGERPSRRDVFEAVFSGAYHGGWQWCRIPLLSGDTRNILFGRSVKNLEDFRKQEGEEREERLRRVWKMLWWENSSDSSGVGAGNGDLDGSFTRERAEELKKIYLGELIGRCRGEGEEHSDSGYGGQFVAQGRVVQHPISWKEFYRYAEAKEVELWHIFHCELDLDGNGHLDSQELKSALEKADIPLSPTALSEFMTTLTSSPHSRGISFQEFRDFLLLLPREVSTAEIYQYYRYKRYFGEDGRGAARVTMEGDVTLSAEDKPPLTSNSFPGHSIHVPSLLSVQPPLADQTLEPQGEQQKLEIFDEEEHRHRILGSTAVKYLLAGGVAGAVSRTCTAPFDRLKIFLITRPEERGPNGRLGTQAIANALRRIYAENGAFGFWIGNGLSVVKILPESAIKFLSYETSKRFFAEYWDHVDDPKEISQTSRFFSGGIGGITSQLSIYPIETVKTQMMSNTGGGRKTVLAAVKHVYALGGMRVFYRGLTIGLIGVFPYSAIDMSTFEALKLAYVRSTGKEEPGVLALLAFGSVSGSVGATSVFPLNLVRTRLQASGSPAHPQRYSGIWDVVQHTYKQSGVRGFYIGLGPTLAKVIPAVSISYVVYEHSKRRFGV